MSVFLNRELQAGRDKKGSLWKIRGEQDTSVDSGRIAHAGSGGIRKSQILAAAEFGKICERQQGYL